MNYRSEFELIKGCVDICTDMGKDPSTNGVVIELKRKLRARLNAKPHDAILVKEDNDGYVEKQFFDHPFTDEEKRRFEEDNRIYTGCAYDCSGRPFTRWIEIFNIETSFGAKSVVYHSIGYDV